MEERRTAEKVQKDRIKGRVGQGENRKEKIALKGQKSSRIIGRINYVTMGVLRRRQRRTFVVGLHLFWPIL